MAFWCKSKESHGKVLQLDAVKREIDSDSGGIKESSIKVEILSTPQASGAMRLVASVGFNFHSMFTFLSFFSIVFVEGMLT